MTKKKSTTTKPTAATKKKTTKKKATTKTTPKKSTKTKKKASAKTAKKKTTKKKSGEIKKKTETTQNKSNNGEVTPADIAKQLEGINASQVRILQCLKRKHPKEIDKAELKEGVGIGRDGKYSSKWNAGLWELYNDGLIKIQQLVEGSRQHYHVITKKGIEKLQKAEKEAKEDNK